jgi:hypothetical protein
MHGAVTPLPQYAFMVWCSVKKEEKHRDNFKSHAPLQRDKGEASF